MLSNLLFTLSFFSINSSAFLKISLNVFSFKDSFQDKQVKDFFINILDDYKPNIIHYQHLMFLSTDIIKMASKKNIHQVISLHDFWFQCLTHKRITNENKLCVNPTIEKCTKCHLNLINRTLPMPPLKMDSINIMPFLRNTALLARINKYKKRMRNLTDYYFYRNKLSSQVKYRINTFKEVLKLVDAVVYPTKFLQTELYKWGIKGKNNLISNDGIQNKYFDNFEKKKSKIIRFGFIGSIVHAKGLIVLVQAWKKINSDRAVLKIYGNFSDDPIYAKKVIKIINKCKNIQIKGTFNHDQIGIVFSQLDVLIVPSTWFENAPLVIRNAFLAKTPVIGTNLGGISEMITDKKNGLLFENGNVDDLYNKISYFIQHPKSIEKMGKNCPPQKTIIENALELKSIYKSLLKSK